MPKTPRKAVVSKRVSEDEKMNAKRWEGFLIASALPFGQLTESWLNVFDCQSCPELVPVSLVRLVDVAIAEDEKK